MLKNNYNQQSKYATVTQVNNYVHNELNSDVNLSNITMVGEISNYRYRPYGHQYFSLKDNNSEIDAVMFKWQFKTVNFKPKNGMKVIVFGKISLYQPRGTYQILINHMIIAGIGLWHIKLDKLKRKLEKAGIFNVVHKKAIPKFPKRIATITSSHGSVIRDIIKVYRARYPIVQIVLFPASVQGKQAPEELVKRIQQVNSGKWGHFDTIIFGRGGGSAEDLWPFEEKGVVMAIYNSKVPIISSIGHETDTTLSDYAADLRAATPTEAAEQATPMEADVLTQINQWRQVILHSYQNKINYLGNQLHKITSSYLYKHPSKIYEPYMDKVESYLQLLKSQTEKIISTKQDLYTQSISNLKYNSPMEDINNNLQKIILLKQRILDSTKSVLQDKNNTFAKRISILNDASPLKVMARGFTFISKNKKPIKSIKDIRRNQNIKLTLKDGQAEAKVLHTRKITKKGN